MLLNSIRNDCVGPEAYSFGPGPFKVEKCSKQWVSEKWKSPNIWNGIIEYVFAKGLYSQSIEYFI